MQQTTEPPACNNSTSIHDVNDEGTAMVRVDGSTDAFATHADAVHRETGDVDTPITARGSTLNAKPRPPGRRVPGPTRVMRGFCAFTGVMAPTARTTGSKADSRIRPRESLGCVR